MIVTKFGNLEDFFNFLEAKRDEIQAAFTQQTVKEAEKAIEEVDLKDTSTSEQIAIIQSQNLELQDIEDMTIERELEDYNYTSVNATPNSKAKCIQPTPTFKSSQDQNNLQLAWSASLETPGSSHKDTDTTMIMGQLTLKDDEFDDIEDIDGLDELIEDYCDYDLDLDFDMEQEISSAQEDPLGLDSLAFPMSQFPGSDAGSLELNDDDIISSDFDLNNNDSDNSEFELDISMSQFPSTQVAMQSAPETEKQIDETESFVIPTVISFTTGRGAAMPPPSKEAMKRARSLVEQDEQFTEEKENTPIDNAQAQPFPMFTTGRGKAIAPPTEEAIKRARSMIEKDALDLDLNPESEPKFPAFPAFTTAKGKTLPPPSKEALDRANKLVNTEAEITPPVNDDVPKMVGFSTGRGKAMKPPSEEALKRAQELVSDFTESSKTINAVKTQSKVVPAKKPLVPGNTAFKPHNIRPTNVSTTTAPMKPFSLSNAWKRPRPRTIIPAQKSVTIPPPPPPKLFDLSTEGMTRFKLRDFFKTPPNSNIKEYHSYGITSDVLRMTSNSAKEYRFGTLQWGAAEAHKCLLENGAQKTSISEDWTANHFRWIVWKFASFIRSFPEDYSSANLSPSWVLSQLLYRYEREVQMCHRSALKKIVERDDAAGKLMCLLVAGIDFKSRALELSDGWYSIWTGKLDSSLWELVERGRLREGIKIEVSGATLSGGQDAIPALEASSPSCQCRLTIARNSCRPARWDTKLGFIRSVAFLKMLQQVHDNGGPVPAVSVVIDRVYPLLFREERTMNSNSNENEGHTGHVRVVKRNERDHYLYLESNAEQAQTSKFTPLQRIRVRGPANSAAIVSLWNPLGEDQRALLQEGSAVIITNLRAKPSGGKTIKSLVSSKSTRLFKEQQETLNFPALPQIIISLGLFDGFKDLQVNELYDVSGVSLGRVGNYFWLGWPDTIIENNCIIPSCCCYLVCIMHFTAHLGAGEAVNFRDLCFNHFDAKEGVAHFSFNEYSDFKRMSGNSVAGFKAAKERFKQLTFSD